MGLSNDDDLRVDRVTSVQALDGLEPHWRALEDLADCNSPFLGWDWQRLWWRHYGGERQLCVLVAWRGDRLVGVLPLYLETHRAFGLLPVRKLRPIGAGGDTSPDDLGMLCDPTVGEAAGRALVDHLLHHVSGWQLIDLVDLPVGGILVRCMAEAFATKPDLMQSTGVNRITYGTAFGLGQLPPKPQPQPSRSHRPKAPPIRTGVWRALQPCGRKGAD